MLQDIQIGVAALGVVLWTAAAVGRYDKQLSEASAGSCFIFQGWCAYGTAW
jgi:hypothetical protein